MRIDPELLSGCMPRVEARLARLSSSECEALAGELLQGIADPARPVPERIAAGNALGLLGDPRIDPLRPVLCPVPRGPFWMGVDASEVGRLARRHSIPEAWLRKSTPRHQIVLDAYEIARFPVTEGEYERFLRDTGADEVPGHWIDRRPPPYRTNHPVHGVSWQGVLLYAQWISEATGTPFRVPTEAEWEKAARGGDGRAFPWGDRFDPGRCNTREGGAGGTTPVGSYPAGASPCGALDLAGNVEELTADLYRPYPGSAFPDPEYGTYRVTRGGVYSLGADLARCDRRHGTVYAGSTGFRLIRPAAPWRTDESHTR